MGSLPHSLSAAMSIFPKACLPCLEDPLILGHNAATWHASGRRAAGLSRRGKKVLPPLSGSEGKQEKKKKKAVCSRGSKAYKRKIKWVAEKCAHTQKRVTTLVVSYTTGQQVSLFKSPVTENGIEKALYILQWGCFGSNKREEGTRIMNEQQGQL